MIAVVDYCAGNLRSVVRALNFLKIENEVTSDPKKIKKAAGVIVPGVGAAGTAMQNLQKAGLVEVLRQWCLEDKPFFGICLGLQILFEVSEEDNSKCLGVFEGSVKKFRAPKIKIPHIGWNQVDFLEPPPVLLDGVESGTPFYFVHSFFANPIEQKLVVATATHGEIFPAVVNRGKVWGVQFHPEKSGNVGFSIFKNFAKIAEG